MCFKRTRICLLDRRRMHTFWRRWLASMRCRCGKEGVPRRITVERHSRVSSHTPDKEFLRDSYGHHYLCFKLHVHGSSNVYCLLNVYCLFQCLLTVYCLLHCLLSVYCLYIYVYMSIVYIYKTMALSIVYCNVYWRP